MPAESTSVVRSASNPMLDQQRRSERRACNIAVTMRARSGDFLATLQNLSAGGVGLRIDSLVALKPGESMTLVHPDLGEVPCVLRWCVHPRYGAEFTASRLALTQIRAFYDRLPPDPSELI